MIIFLISKHSSSHHGYSKHILGVCCFGLWLHWWTDVLFKCALVGTGRHGMHAQRYLFEAAACQSGNTRESGANRSIATDWAEKETRSLLQSHRNAIRRYMNSIA